MAFNNEVLGSDHTPDASWPDRYYEVDVWVESTIMRGGAYDVQIVITKGRPEAALRIALKDIRKKYIDDPDSTVIASDYEIHEMTLEEYEDMIASQKAYRKKQADLEAARVDASNAYSPFHPDGRRKDYQPCESCHGAPEVHGSCNCAFARDVDDDIKEHYQHVHEVYDMDDPAVDDAIHMSGHYRTPRLEG